MYTKDFLTYLKKFPDENGYFGRFGGAYLTPELENAMKEITDAYWSICKSSEFVSELRRIRKEFQGMKLSNILMEDCFNRVELLGCEKINLEVRVTNERAINLYKKHGFKEVIVRKDYYGKGEDALILSKVIGDDING